MLKRIDHPGFIDIHRSSNTSPSSFWFPFIVLFHPAYLFSRLIIQLLIIFTTVTSSTVPSPNNDIQPIHYSTSSTKRKVHFFKLLYCKSRLLDRQIKNDKSDFRTLVLRIVQFEDDWLEYLNRHQSASKESRKEKKQKKI